MVTKAVWGHFFGTGGVFFMLLFVLHNCKKYGKLGRILGIGVPFSETKNKEKPLC